MTYTPIMVSRTDLLHLCHVMDYGLAFNNTNEGLDEIQQRRFALAGADLSLYRDPFTPYLAGSDLTQLYALCELSGAKEVIRTLNDDIRHSRDMKVVITRPAWLFDTIRDAITRYDERHMFFMTDRDYKDPLTAALGADGYQALHDELQGFLGSNLQCGQADSSVRRLKMLLTQFGVPYAPPPAPYKQKLEAVSRAYLQSLNDYFKKRPFTASHPIYSYAELARIRQQAHRWVSRLMQTSMTRLPAKLVDIFTPLREQGVWTRRLELALLDCAEVLRKLPRSRRVPFFYACMTGNIPELRHLFIHTHTPPFLTNIPGGWVVAPGVARLQDNRLREQLVWLFWHTTKN